MECGTTTVLEHQDLKDSTDKKTQKTTKQYFSDSESITPSSKKGERRKLNSYLGQPVRLYNWNQPILHNENYKIKIRKTQKKDSTRQKH